MTAAEIGEKTLEQIVSQPATWRASLARLLADRARLEQCAALLDGVEPIITGSGTSYYCARTAATVFTKLSGRTARGIAACDIMAFPHAVLPKGSNVALIAISRKGANVEPVEAAKYFRNVLGRKVIGISCTPGSELLDYCDASLVLPEGSEWTRYMTRSFSSMLLACQLLAAVKTGDREFEQALLKLPDATQRIVDRNGPAMEKLAREIQCSQYIYLGLGPYYGLACESMLKTKEMARTPAEAYHTIELFHGPNHALFSNCLITVLLSDTALERELAIIDRARALESPPQIKIICEKATPEIAKRADYLVELNTGLPEYARALAVMPVTQLFGFYRAAVNKVELR